MNLDGPWSWLHNFSCLGVVSLQAIQILSAGLQLGKPD